MGCSAGLLPGHALQHRSMGGGGKPAIIFVDPFAENQAFAGMPGLPPPRPLDARAAVQDLGREIRPHPSGGGSDVCLADQRNVGRPPGGGAEPALDGIARRRAGARRGDPGAALGHRRHQCRILRDHQRRRYPAAAADRLRQRRNDRCRKRRRSKCRSAPPSFGHEAGGQAASAGGPIVGNDRQRLSRRGSGAGHAGRGEGAAEAKPETTKAETAKPETIKRSVKPINVILVGDADMLMDRNWIQQQNCSDSRSPRRSPTTATSSSTRSSRCPAVRRCRICAGAASRGVRSSSFNRWKRRPTSASAPRSSS